MSDSILALKNLGPATARMLAEIDITTQNELRNLGSVEAYRRLKFRFGTAVTLNALYALEAALQDRHWLSLTPAERMDLKRRAG